MFLTYIRNYPFFSPLALSLLWPSAGPICCALPTRLFADLFWGSWTASLPGASGAPALAAAPVLEIFWMAWGGRNGCQPGWRVLSEEIGTKWSVLLFFRDFQHLSRLPVSDVFDGSQKKLPPMEPNCKRFALPASASPLLAGFEVCTVL